jgi:hypothetical protein
MAHRNVRLIDFDASTNTESGVNITGLTGAFLEHFTTFSNVEERVILTGRSGSTLSKFSAGAVGTGGSSNLGVGVDLDSSNSRRSPMARRR